MTFVDLRCKLLGRHVGSGLFGSFKTSTEDESLNREVPAWTNGSALLQTLNFTKDSPRTCPGLKPAFRSLSKTLEKHDLRAWKAAKTLFSCETLNPKINLFVLQAASITQSTNTTRTPVYILHDLAWSQEWLSHPGSFTCQTKEITE